MSLENQYDRVLLEEMLKASVVNGTVPHLDELQAQLDQMKHNSPALGTAPLVSTETHKLTYYDNASASEQNNFSSSALRDITALLDIISTSHEEVVKLSARWSGFYEMTRRTLDDLEDQIDELLLVRRDTLGYYYALSDDFTTVNYVDLEHTTAHVDTGSGLASIGESSSGPGTISRIEPSNWLPSFSVLSASGLQSSQSSPMMSVENVLSDEYTQWTHEVTTASSGVVTGALTLKLGDGESISKIVFKSAGASSTSSVLVTLMYSVDGIDYVVAPVSNAAQSISTQPATWVFPEITVKSVRIIMSKNSHDDTDHGRYLYYFGGTLISLYNQTFETLVGYSLVTTIRETEQLFRKASLMTCEVLPEGTDITYSLSVDEGATWALIDPINRATPSHPTVLDFSESFYIISTNETSSYDSSLQITAIDYGNIGGLTLGSGDAVLNYYVPAAIAQDIFEQTHVYRNVAWAGNTNTFGTVWAGWSYDHDNQLYKTIVSVDDPDGLSINIGSTVATLNGVLVTGTFTIPQGQSLFSTSSTNMYAIEGTYDSESELIALDPIYPYNHKLLIEGIEYSSSYVGEKLYFGADFIAEKHLDHITQHEFYNLTDENNLQVYTEAVDLNGNTAFLVKNDTNSSDTNEQFVVKFHQLTNTFDSIVLKAEFVTQNSGLTPLLDSYTIKLG